MFAVSNHVIRIPPLRAGRRVSWTFEVSAADAADVLRDANRKARCTDAVTLAKEMLATHGGGHAWNPRTGYGDQL